MTGPPQLFLDANVWFVAACTPTGASAPLLGFCRDGRCRATVTRRILQEAERNLATKTKAPHVVMLRFSHLIAGPGPQVVGPPAPADVAAFAGIIHPKDAHILAGTTKARAAVSSTLDCKHFGTATVRQTRLPVEILTPGAFLRRFIAE